MTRPPFSFRYPLLALQSKNGRMLAHEARERNHYGAQERTIQ
jgi:hypothetical protein